MLLWRISSVRRARDFSGGYGLVHAGRWNTPVRPVTYAASGPALAALEKRVHVGDPALLPPQAAVAYEVPDDLPADWTRREIETQRIGNAWLDAAGEALLFVPSVVVPSVVVPFAGVPDRNVLINHRHAGTRRIRIARVVLFTLDVRLFGTGT